MIPGQFSLVVLPDTQYLFDGGNLHPQYLQSTFEHLAHQVDGGFMPPILHIAHVGDVTEHGTEAECRAASGVLDAARALLPETGWSVVAGNHDVDDSGERAHAEFFRWFGAESELYKRTPSTFSPDGFSHRYLLDTPAGPWQILALDWRLSPSALAWAQGVLLQDAGSRPTVVITHDVAGGAALTGNGERLWDQLIEPYSQIFLAVGGHEWPSVRLRRNRPDGSPVEIHTVNFQDAPFGGAGMYREYRFTPARRTCEVITRCPSLPLDPRLSESVEARRSLAAADAANQFRFDLPELVAGSDVTQPWILPAGAELVITSAEAGGSWLQDTDFEFGFVLEAVFWLPPAGDKTWMTVLAKTGCAPDGSPEPLAALSVSTERFITWMAYDAHGTDRWSTSHAVPAGSRAHVLVSTGLEAGMWVNGDQVLRNDLRPGQGLSSDAEAWVFGGGYYDGRLADAFTGSIESIRLWRLPAATPGVV